MDGLVAEKSTQAPSVAMAGADTRPPCRFYQVGQCRAGSICKFAHVKDSTNKLKIAAPCKFFFNQGYCAHGDRCAFSHEKKPAPRAEVLDRKALDARREHRLVVWLALLIVSMTLLISGA